jgi:hypothetical protein
MADQPAPRSKPDLDREAAEAAPRAKVNRMVALGILGIVAVISAGVFFSSASSRKSASAR